MATAFKKMAANKLVQDRNQDSDDEPERPRAESDEIEASEHDSALDIDEEIPQIVEPVVSTLKPLIFARMN
jgi:hypothetical protein